MWSFFLLILLFSTHPSLSFQSALPNPFSFFRLDSLPPQLTDVRFNETMGHPDALLAIGINNKEAEPDSDQATVEANVEPVDVRSYLIPISELAGALEKALEISSQSHEEIKKSGWKVVHQSDIFSLYKRRLKRPGGGDGPVEYLMTGALPDVSPRTFLHSQIDKQCRKQWDKTMKDMSDGSTSSMETGGSESEDILYYRTKWPWPLKDRDYTLARRCKLFEEKNAIVLVSKSTECLDHPAADGVIRVDNYWCHSAILSTRPKEDTSSIAAARSIISGDTGIQLAEGADNGSSGINSNSNSNSEYDNFNNPKNIPQLDTSSSVPPSPPIGADIIDNETNNINDNVKNKIQNRIKKFDPRARLKEIKKNAEMKSGPAFAAKLRSQARAALQASRLLIANNNENKNNIINVNDKDIKKNSINDNNSNNINDTDTKNENQDIITPKILAVDLPGMSFITLFCDDQRVPLPSSIVDILSKQGEKVVPESINRLHEIAREVEDKKQFLLGTTVEAAISSSGINNSGSSSNVQKSDKTDNETEQVGSIEKQKSRPPF